jgi:peroxiredoxin
MILLVNTQLALAGLNIGDAIVDADIKMKNIDGAMVSINDIRGEKGTLVIFSCNHCPFVKGWQKTMVKIGNTYHKQGIGVVFINSNDLSTKGDSFKEMQGLAKQEDYKFPYVVDDTSNVARNFGATKTPDVFLFDASGKLVYKGAIGEGGRTPTPGGATWLKDSLDALLAGNEIPRQETKAVGCSIKFR